MKDYKNGRMKFRAEIKEIKQTKSVSLDHVYSIKLITDEQQIMDLSKIPPDEIVEVEISQEE